MKSLRAGIAGGAGYTGGQLIRLLHRHPDVELVFVHSKSQMAKPIAQIHRDLQGEVDMNFGPIEEVDVLFLCMGHGESTRFLEEHPPSDTMKIIDLSHDFRLAREDHEFVYGLPELNRPSLAEARHIANPGCFATAIQLALLPMAGEGMLPGEVHISAVTGSTGAGQKPTATTHFSWRYGNISVYKAFQHQHLAEIRQSLAQLQPGYDGSLVFLPFRGTFTRGILAAVYLAVDEDLEVSRNRYQKYYRGHPFVHLVDENPDVKQVVGTNKCFLYLDRPDGERLLVVSIIDNLLKGAAGQAVQNMNISFGLDEQMGLDLMGIGF